MKKTLAELASLVDGRVIGDENTIVEKAKPLELADEKSISFVKSVSYAAQAKKSKACAFILQKEEASFEKPVLISDNPYLAFAKIMNLFLSEEKKIIEKGVHSTAIIKENVGLGDNISIMEYVVIGKNTEIGKNVIIMPFSYIGENVRINDNTLIYPNVTILDNVEIGMNTIIHSGTVIGSDGFGYIQEKDKTQYKIPQTGGVFIGDNVEIGSNVAVDRSTFGKTIIKNGVKIDNLVQIAHNSEIGENSILVAQVGLSGSVKIGKNTILAGQVGVADHVEIGDDSIAFAKSGIHKNLPKGSKVFGTPAQDMKKALEVVSFLSSIHKLKSKIKELEERILKLEQR